MKAAVEKRKNRATPASLARALRVRLYMFVKPDMLTDMFGSVVPVDRRAVEATACL